MKRSFLVFLTLMSLLISAGTYGMEEEDIRALYSKMKLSEEISYDLFRDTIVGYEKIQEKRRKGIVTIIDYSKPSTEERFYVLDLRKKEVIYKTRVAHGVNTGGNKATSFSNIVDSRQSSLGFFLTNETYYGSNGYSLRLDGLERGINDRARERAIVIHGAKYANDSFLRKNGRLGRSWGCPALPTGLNREIIDTIKGGSVIFVHGEDKRYAKRSEILKDLL